MYLYGKEFVVRTDHRPLQWLKDLKNPSTRLARWLIIARQFAFRIEFLSGTQNAAADALSRFFLYGGEEVENFEEPEIVLNNIQVEKHTAATTSDENLEILREWIVKGSKSARLESGVSTELKREIQIDLGSRLSRGKKCRYASQNHSGWLL